MVGILLSLSPGCRTDPDLSAPPEPAECELPLVYEKSPADALEGTGWHRLYVQGGSATPDADGRYGIDEHRTDIATGDHFLLSAGALVEWTYPVLDPITGLVSVHIARVDEPGLVARYELFLVRDDELIEMFSIDDEEEGEQGYVPFEACWSAPAAAGEPGPDDFLLMRVTNLTGGQLGIVVNAPDYYTWVDVEVSEP